ncbi:MAG: hypothetical protein ABI467_14505 [Kofleriaceae bacterium]
MQRADFELTLTLLETKLIIQAGETRLEQEFANEAALVEHALRVVKLRQAEGYRVVGERKDDQIVLPPEPKTDAPKPAPKPEPEPDEPEAKA